MYVSMHCNPSSGCQIQEVIINTTVDDGDDDVIVNVFCVCSTL